MLILGLVILAALALGLIHLYNRLVRERQATVGAFSQIEVHLQRRYDLIPNLVAGVKAALGHERETLTAVIQARNDAHAALGAIRSNGVSVDSLEHLKAAETSLRGAMGQLKVTIEAYPELRAQDTIVQLNEEITSTENRLGFARQAFNDAIERYNTSRELFPVNVVAGLFGFAAGAFWKVDDPAIRQAPKVQF